MNRFVTIAKITRTHGIHGEVTALILTDFPDRFQDIRTVHLAATEKDFWEELESHRLHKNRILLKFRGRDRPHEVQELVGCEVQILESERVELPEDTYFDSDLVGCQVLEGNAVLGRVDDLLKSGTDVTNLVVSGPGETELIVPLVSQFVKEVDVSKKLIRVELPPGMADL